MSYKSQPPEIIFGNRTFNNNVTVIAGSQLVSDEIRPVTGSGSFFIKNSLGTTNLTLQNDGLCLFSSALRLGTTLDLTDGNLRWTGADFEGRKGGAWTTLTSGTAGQLVTIGDGVTKFGNFNGTNQTPFINAIASIPNGGIIKVLAGTYTFTAKLTISTNNITLVGEGREISVITGAIASDAIVQVSATGCRLQDLTITQTSGPSENFAVLLSGNSNFFENCRFQHTYAGGTLDNAPYKALKITGNYNVVQSNILTWTPSIRSSSTYRSALSLEIVAAVSNIELNGNRIDNNLFESIANTADAGLDSSAILVKADATGAGHATIRNNTITRNVVKPTGSFKGADAWLLMKTTKTSTGDPFINEVSVQGNIFLPTAVTAIYKLDAQAGNQITNNSILGNQHSTFVSAFSYTNVGNTGNSLNMLAFAGESTFVSKIVDPIKTAQANAVTIPSITANTSVDLSVTFPSGTVPASSQAIFIKDANNDWPALLNVVESRVTSADSLTMRLQNVRNDVSFVSVSKIPIFLIVSPLSSWRQLSDNDFQHIASVGPGEVI